MLAPPIYFYLREKLLFAEHRSTQHFEIIYTTGHIQAKKLDLNIIILFHDRLFRSVYCVTL